MARSDDAMIGRTIAGKFLIESLIGSGAMGRVYRAQQFALEKTVALKVLHSELARDETFAARFHREAKAASRLDHPNSMRVLDFGTEPDGMLYIAMEYLDGRDLLRVILEDGPLSTERIAGIVQQSLAALVVAHDMGVVHRDLKPENIMVLPAVDDEGHHTDVIKVCDFGIAKITHRAGGETEPTRGPITTAGLVVGTPEYMSPEQGRGDPLDARSDLYSMGVILFHLLTGRLPFDGENVLGIVFKHVNEEPPNPSSIRAGVDPRLEAICLRALKKNRNDRYQTARDMRAALRPIAGSDGVVFPKSVGRGVLPSSDDLQQARTVGLAGTLGSAPAVSEPTLSRGTPGGTAALPRLPVSRPSIVWLGFSALLAGAAGTLLFSAYRDGSAAVVPVVGQYATTPAPPASSSPSSSASAASAEAVATAAQSSSAVVGAKASVPSHVHKDSPASSHAAPTPAMSAMGTPSFSLTTSSASPSVVRAAGVAPQSVRAALPSWKFTQCYRDAMQKSGRRLEGHVTLSLILDASGTVTRVSIVGPPTLLGSVGSCFEDAVNQLHIHNSSASGATSDVDVLCDPE